MTLNKEQLKTILGGSGTQESISEPHPEAVPNPGQINPGGTEQLRGHIVIIG